jgi:DnaJ domain
MVFFLAGLFVLLVIIFGARLFATLDPRRLAGLLRRLGGVAALAIAAFLTARGALPLAIPLAVFGFALLGGKSLGLGGSFGTGRKSPRQKSEIRTEWLVMELDHDSGRMEGRCLKGKFAGRALPELSEAELRLLLDELRVQSGQDAVLLEAYLDRRFPGWREAAGRAREGKRGPGARGARMSAEEAFAVLGLEPGAKAEEIRDAHRRLMKKLHPDQGGSNYLAARINEAKEVLLGGK